jgi:hypothetical protein
MKILREGDRGTALSTDGRGWVPITYRYRSVRLEETGIDVPNVLVGVDDETDEILVIPNQSTPRLKAARRQVKEETIQVKIPHELDDILVVIADRFMAPEKKFTPALLRYYLYLALKNPKLCGRLFRLSERPLARGKTGTRLSFRAGAEFGREIREAARGCGGGSVSELTRGAILAAKEDLVDGKSGPRTRQLEAVARAL